MSIDYGYAIVNLWHAWLKHPRVAGWRPGWSGLLVARTSLPGRLSQYDVLPGRVALVSKHGLVPKSAMPETKSSGETRHLNRDLSTIDWVYDLLFDKPDGSQVRMIWTSLRPPTIRTTIAAGVKRMPRKPSGPDRDKSR